MPLTVRFHFISQDKSGAGLKQGHAVHQHRLYRVHPLSSPWRTSVILIAPRILAKSFIGLSVTGLTLKYDSVGHACLFFKVIKRSGGPSCISVGILKRGGFYLLFVQFSDTKFRVPRK